MGCTLQEYIGLRGQQESGQGSDAL